MQHLGRTGLERKACRQTVGFQPVQGLKPGVRAIDPATLVMLGGALAYACSLIMTKRIARQDTTYAVLFYMQAIQLPIAFLLALPVWISPAIADFPWLIVVGAAGIT